MVEGTGVEPAWSAKTLIWSQSHDRSVSPPSKWYEKTHRCNQEAGVKMTLLQVTKESWR